jgi:hypothetical protein
LPGFNLVMVTTDKTSKPNKFQLQFKQNVLFSFQMFDEEDLDSEALLVSSEDGNSVPLDRLQVI